MTGRTHDLAAVTLLGAVVVVAPLEPMTLSTALVALLANQIGGLAPDIDQPTAPFWRNLPIGGAVGKIVHDILGGHRSITHSLLGVIAIGFLAHWLLVFAHPIMPNVDIDIVLAAFIIGVISHLIMDSFTKEGVPWLLPIPVKFGFPPLKKLRITTGKSIEKIFVFPGIAFVLIWLCASNYTELLSLIQKQLTA